MTLQRRIWLECDGTDCDNTLEILRLDCPELFGRNRGWYVGYRNEACTFCPSCFQKSLLTLKGDD